MAFKLPAISPATRGQSEGRESECGTTRQVIILELRYVHFLVAPFLNPHELVSLSLLVIAQLSKKDS